MLRKVKDKANGKQRASGAYYLYGESIADLRDIPLSDQKAQHFEDSTSGKSQRWFGVPSREDVYHAVEKGWTEGRTKAENNFGQVTVGGLSSRRRKRRFSSAGGVMVDPHRLYSGNMDFWEDYPRSHLSSGGVSHVTIDVNIGGSCARSDEEMFWSGAVAALAANALIKSGRHVRVVGGFGVTNADASGRYNLYCNFEAKGYNEPFNLDRLLSLCALSGTFRTYGFRAIISIDEKEHPALGFPANSYTDENKAAPKTPGEEFIRIPMIHNVEQARAKLREIESMFNAQKAA